MGRVGDRIGGAYMIPASDVEAALLDHPAVADSGRPQPLVANARERG